MKQLTLRELIETAKGLPHNAPVLYQRLPDRYFTELNWPSTSIPWGARNSKMDYVAAVGCHVGQDRAGRVALCVMLDATLDAQGMPGDTADFNLPSDLQHYLAERLPGRYPQVEISASDAMPLAREAAQAFSAWFINEEEIRERLVFRKQQPPSTLHPLLELFKAVNEGTPEALERYENSVPKDLPAEQDVTITESEMEEGKQNALEGAATGLADKIAALHNRAYFRTYHQFCNAQFFLNWIADVLRDTVNEYAGLPAPQRMPADQVTAIVLDMPVYCQRIEDAYFEESNWRAHVLTSPTGLAQYIGAHDFRIQTDDSGTSTVCLNAHWG